MFDFKDNQKIEFANSLDTMHNDFDESCNMIYWDFKRSPTSYHTALPTGRYHHTNSTMQYALMLLDDGSNENLQRAIKVLWQMVNLQDKDKNSDTCGIWSWYYEEPLDKMSPPDWNWADFIGKILIQVIKDYKNILPDDLVKALEETCDLACFSICRRQVPATYTNIALMDIYMTIVTGEQLEIDYAFDYGMEHLENFLLHTKSTGTFSEYNSPTYTIVALEELSRAKKDIKNIKAINMIDELLEICWEIILFHYHKKTCQWSGPHSRTYQTLKDTNDLVSILNTATDGYIKFPPNVAYKYKNLIHRCNIKCPQKVLEKFKQLPSEYDITDEYQSPEFNTMQKATSYMTDDFTLSSFRISTLWTQRRPLVAYMGNSKAPVFIRLRFLNNGHDFCSAMLHSNQKNGSVIGIVNISNDGGDTHPNLDMLEDKKFTTSDLRLRLEIYTENKINSDSWVSQGNFNTSIANNIIQYNIIRSNMDYENSGNCNAKFDYSYCNGINNFDCILYAGDEKEIDLDLYNEITVAFALSIQDYISNEISVNKDNDRLYIKTGNLECSALLKSVDLRNNI